MIFNELTKNSNYNVEEVARANNGTQYRATVVYDGIEHDGYGKLRKYWNFFNLKMVCGLKLHQKESLF